MDGRWSGRYLALTSTALRLATILLQVEHLAARCGRREALQCLHNVRTLSASSIGYLQLETTAREGAKYLTGLMLFEFQIEHMPLR